jgi:hypothetical protein
MKKLLLLTLLFMGIELLAQPINMIEREMKFKLDSNMNYIGLENHNGIIPDKDSEVQEGENKISIKPNSAVESEVHAAINPTDKNNIIVSPIYQDVTTGGFPDLYCSVYYTKDDGKTWNKSNFETTTLNYPQSFIIGGGDPILVFDNNGRAYLSWLYFFQNANGRLYGALYWAYSDDGGATWQNTDEPFISLSENLSTNQIELPDKQWMTVTDNNDIITVYTLSQSSQTGQNSYIYMAVKKNGDENFSEPVQVSQGDFDIVQFATASVDANQKVHILYTGYKSGDLALYYTTTSDLGNTFSEKKKVSDFTLPRSIFDQSGTLDTIPGITVRRLYPAPMIVADNNELSPHKNNLYVAWTANGINGNAGRKMDIYFTKSTDGGTNWDTPKVLNLDSPEKPVSNYYPSLSVNSQGVLAVTYYDRTIDMDNDLQTFYVIQTSSDGGENFTAPEPLSTLSSDFSKIGLRNNGFGVGEYNMLLNNGEEFIPVWADGRENSGDVSVYTARVSLGPSNVEVVNRISSVNKIVNASIDQSNISNLELYFQKPSLYSFTVMGLDGNVLFKTADKMGSKGTMYETVDLSKLSSGVYFIVLNSASSTSIAKVIVQ